MNRRCALLIVAVLVALGPVTDAQTFSLTDEERAWLDDHPVIRVAPAPNFPPMEYFDDQGVYRGVMADYAKILETRLGIKFEIAQYDAWQDVVAATKAREVDMWMEAQDTPERREFLNITPPYVHLPVVIIVRREMRGTIELSDLIGLKVAVIEGYESSRFVRDNHPDLELIPVPSIEVGLERVSFGAADALVASIGGASYYIERNGITNLRVAGTSGFEWHLCMAVRSDWPELFDLMQRALDSVEISQRQEIYRRWIALEVDTKSGRFNLLWVGGAILLAILAFVLVRRSFRPRQVPTTYSLRATLLGAWPVLTTAGLAIVVVLAAGLWSRSILIDRAHQDVANALRTVLNTTSQAVHDWFGEREAEAHDWASRPAVQRHALALANLREQERLLEMDASIAGLRQESATVIGGGGFDGFTLMALDGQILAADSGSDLKPGARLVLSEQSIDRLAGSPNHTAIELPSRAAGTSAASVSPSIIVSSLVRDSSGTDLAILALHLDPGKDFTRILQRGRIGESGETYAINRRGQLISESRFIEGLEQIGLVEAGQPSILNVDVRDPGGNLLTGYRPSHPREDQPHTLMARTAISGRSGANLDGYNDYRGIPVIGVWVWDEATGLGITTEMDVDDAYAFLHSYRRQAIAATSLAVGLIFGLTGLFIRNRVQMAAAGAELGQAYEIIKKHKERMEEELNIGREIQMSMIPLTFPAFPERREFVVHASLAPAREVGGDFYDFFFIDDDHFCVVVGDVAGKGVPAALFMAVTKTLVKSRALAERSTGNLIAHVNDEISRDNKESMFVTVFVGILDVRSGEFLYTNAGHNPPFVRRANGSVQKLDQRHGPVIGAVDELTYTEDCLMLRPDDLLLMYTDGVTEAFNEQGELFTESRLVEFLESSRTESAKSQVEATVDAVSAFEGDAEQADDITILALHYRGAASNRTTKHTISLTGGPESVGRSILEFDAFAQQQELSGPVARKIKIALDDLLNNIVSYGYPEAPSRGIEILLEIADQRLSVTVIDDGIPFNPLDQKPPRTDESLEDRQIGGLGVHLVRNLADDLSYRRENETNVLTIVFDLSLEESETKTS